MALYKIGSMVLPIQSSLAQSSFLLYIYIFIYVINSQTGEAAKRKTLDWPTRLSIALGAARGK